MNAAIVIANLQGLAAMALVLAGVDRGVSEGLCAMAAQAGSPEAVVALGPVSEDRVHALRL